MVLKLRPWQRVAEAYYCQTCGVAGKENRDEYPTFLLSHPLTRRMLGDGTAGQANKVEYVLFTRTEMVGTWAYLIVQKAGECSSPVCLER